MYRSIAVIVVLSIATAGVVAAAGVCALRVRTTHLAILAEVVSHGLGMLAVGLCLILVVPWFKNTFEELEIALSRYVDLFISASNNSLKNWILWAGACLVALLVDAVFFARLRGRASTRSKAYAGSAIITGVLVLAIVLPVALLAMVCLTAAR